MWCGHRHDIPIPEFALASIDQGTALQLACLSDVGKVGAADVSDARRCRIAGVSFI